MRRWNGWGDETMSYALPQAAADLLHRLLGPGRRPRDASLAEVVATVPPSRLPAHPLVSVDVLDRLRHARGQSFPDLIALRSGAVPCFPDGVAYPNSAADVRALLSYSQVTGAQLIPYGGGTSVVGHINPQGGSAPVLTVDLRRLNRLHALDTHSRLATFGAGIAGPDLEAQLRAHGYTLGHYPQSFEGSTLGGWIATRSSGQQSLGYGRIEQLFAGGSLEAPAGTLILAPFPASATGPDMREIVLGSEGRLGILTEAIVRISPLPEREAFHAVFFSRWEQAHAAIRALAQSDATLSLLRLSTPMETAMSFALAGHPRMVMALKGLLALRGVRFERSMLLIGLTGSAALVEASLTTVLAIVREHGGAHLGTALGRQWQKGRFRAPYLRNDLWERGYAVDTVETATTWNNLSPLLDAIEHTLRSGLADQGERVHAFTHLSHVYPHGSSLYTTFVFRLADSADETYRRWYTLKAAVSRAILVSGGTISHQHGIGADHRAYLLDEKGPLAVAAIRQLAATFDPDGRLNPGKLA